MGIGGQPMWQFYLDETIYSSTLPTRFGALLKCRRTMVSHNFPTSWETLVNLKLREATQVSLYSNSNLGSHTQHILCITQDHWTTTFNGNFDFTLPFNRIDLSSMLCISVHGLDVTSCYGSFNVSTVQLEIE